MSKSCFLNCGRKNLYTGTFASRINAKIVVGIVELPSLFYWWHSNTLPDDEAFECFDLDIMSLISPQALDGYKWSSLKVNTLVIREMH